MISRPSARQTFSFVAFLDVFFNALGMFILVILIQERLPQPERPSLQADLLIIADNGVVAEWRSTADPEPQTVLLPQVVDRIRTYAINQGQPVVVIFAHNAELAWVHNYEAELDAILARAAETADPNFFGLRLFWWPLGADGSEKSWLIARWQREARGGDGRAR